jgi:hypothetical protein
MCKAALPSTNVAISEHAHELRAPGELDCGFAVGEHGEQLPVPVRPGRGPEAKS